MPDFDDKELFQEAMADEPDAQAAPEQQQEAEVQQPTGQPRDERGQFAAQEAETGDEPQAAAEPQTDTEQPVPGKRFGEVTRARDEALRRAEDAERRLADAEARMRAPQPQPQTQQPQQAQPDLVDALLTDPEGFLRNRDAQNMQSVGVTLVDMQPGGREARGAAFQALTQLQATNPYAYQAAEASIFAQPPLQQAQAMIDWHKSFQAQQRVGNDPDAFFSRTLEERMANDPEFKASLVEKLTGQARQQQSAAGGKPLLNLPPSLSRQTSAAPAASGGGDMSDTALFAELTR